MEGKKGLRVRMKKCKVDATIHIYLGHNMTNRTTPITRQDTGYPGFSKPTVGHRIKSIFGPTHKLWKFLHNISTPLFPLYRLLRKDHPWSRKTEEASVVSTRTCLLLPSCCFILMQHFHCFWLVMHLPVTLVQFSHAGCQMDQRDLLGMFPCTLSKAEQNYSQLEKEGL